VCVAASTICLRAAWVGFVVAKLRTSISSILPQPSTVPETCRYLVHAINISCVRLQVAARSATLGRKATPEHIPEAIRPNW
jgi:hypothetical protein